jgi:hypothetical protein
MSVEELRQMHALVARALDLYSGSEVTKLSANETRARLSLAAAKRQLADELADRQSKRRSVE